VLKVTAVHPDSIAAELGLQEGTQLLTVNGRELEDFLDWEFLTAEEEILLHVRQPDGEEIEYDIERPLGEPIGVSLEPARIRRCANRCDFCFVDGLPDGLRDVLYIRDDDYRLSFRYGNFATLTNLKPHDVDRIIEYRLSPLYVSVHATDPVVRRYLLRNPTAPDILPQLRQFADHGIDFHTQIVMSPGVNDGPVLRQTLDELYAFGPAILGCSVVPVGLTEYSKHHLVREPTEAECRAAIEVIDERSATARRERGRHWAYGADELYLRAGVELPPAEIYDDFEQVENGVGSVRWLQRRQNPDGGWGETCDSYIRPELAAAGASGPSQTAWALLGLLAAGVTSEPAVERGVQYLLATQRADGGWDDPLWNGTGFPRVFYLKYHLYATYFPLWALGVYRRARRK